MKGNETTGIAARDACSLPVTSTNLLIEDWEKQLNPSSSWTDNHYGIPKLVANKLEILKHVSHWISLLQTARHDEGVFIHLPVGHTRLAYGHLISPPNERSPIYAILAKVAVATL